MKTIQIFATLLLAFLFTNSLIAQNESKGPRYAFGGATFVNTSLVGEWTLEGGGLGAGFINEHLYLGGGGFGISQKISDTEYNMGYGGPMLGYQWGDKGKPKLNFYVLGAYGTITENSGENEIQKDNFWAVRPALEVDFRLTDWMHIGVGGGYRWVMGSDISSLKDGDLSASFGSISLRFGMFSK